MRRALLLLAAALWAGAAFGEGTALGLQLPITALSMWKVGESSAMGLEISGRLEKSRGDHREDTVDSDGNMLSSEIVESENNHYNLNLGLTYKRFRDTGHKIRPFAFWRTSGIVTHQRRDYDGIRESKPTKNRSITLALSTGLGVAWQPFDRVGLWVRQALIVFRRSGSRTDRNGYEFEQSSSGLRLSGPLAIAYFQF